MNPNIKIQTFGCKVNHYDSTLLQEKLEASGIHPEKDVFILNTCSVTAEAGKEARRQADKIKQKHPNSLVVVTGCGAQVETELYSQSKAVDLVIGNSHKKQIPEILNSNNNQKVFKSNIFKVEDVFNGLISKEKDRTRSFLKIQDGCNSFCTFCIIPFARGKSQSLPIEQIVQSVKKLQAQGVLEVVLTGVHIGDYQDGLKSLEDLVEAILKQTSIPRLRLTSLEPIELSDRLLDLYEDERMCAHFHLSIQSASSPVLKTMKRKYGRKEVEDSFIKINKRFPEAFVGMDVIAGFYSETEKDFEETYEVLKNSPWTKMHVFPYSPRTGTYAARSESLKRETIVRRAGLLRHLSDLRFEEHLKKQIGSIKKVLIYKTNSKKGMSRDYWEVDLSSSEKSGEQLVQIHSFDSKTCRLQANWL